MSTWISCSIMNSVDTSTSIYEMAKVSMSKFTTKCMQLLCFSVVIIIYLVKRKELLQTIEQDKTKFKICLVAKDNQSFMGENGLEVILNDEDKKIYKKEISKGYRDFAFNEFVSRSVSIGKLYKFLQLILNCNSIDRNLPDPRHSLCLLQTFNLDMLPDTSGDEIISIFKLFLISVFDSDYYISQ